MDWFLFNDWSLCIVLLLIISEEEIRKVCGIILDGLDKLV